MKLFWVALAVIILSAGVFAMPEGRQNILIVEIQTGSSDSAGEEFVELYNPNDTEVDLADWLLQYKPASSDNWSIKSTLSQAIEPRGRYLIASQDYLVDDAKDTFNSGLAKSGGHIRLVEPAEEEDGEDLIHDLVGWGSAISPDGEQAADAPGAGQSLKRMVDEDGYFVDTDVNLADFIISDDPTPANDDAAPSDTPDGEPADDSSNTDVTDTTDNSTDTTDSTDVSDSSDTSDPVDDNSDATNDTENNTGETSEDTESGLDGVGAIAGTTLPVVYKKVQITELYIDPVSPQTDADDEFIELFNPNETSVELKDYVLQTGNTYSHSFTIPELTIEPGQYLALYSIDTNLALSNSGGQARIIDPNGDVVFQTDKYEKAKAGNSWALGQDGKWLWSTNPTPAAINVIIVPTKATRKKTSSSKSSSRKTKSSSSQVKGSTTKNDDARIIYQEPASIEDTELNMAVLVGVGSMAVGYGVYEYRQDISNRYRQLRKYLKSRR